jgi:16S rRNA (guanine527-N7)-methyltransferase
VWLAERGTALEPAQWDRLGRYAELVLKHNEKTNLTAAKDLDEIADRHLADGLAALPLLKKCLSDVSNPTLADVGAGGGFIGVALQIAWPDCRVCLVESSHRKFLFLNWITVELGLPARAVWQRAQEKHKGSPAAHPPPTWAPKGGFDAAVERALAPLDEAIDACVPLLKPGGLLAAYTSDGKVSDKAKVHLDRVSAALYTQESYRLPGEGHDRTLLAFRRF